MKPLLKVAGTGLFGLGGLAANKIFTKGPKAPVAPPTASIDEARSLIAADDALRRRRGGAADISMGRGGMEAAPGATGKTMMGA